MNTIKLNKENNFLEKRAEYDCWGIYISFKNKPSFAGIIRVELNNERKIEKSIGYFRDAKTSDPKILRISFSIKKGDLVKVIFTGLDIDLEIESFELLILDI
jgi:hypothetical protein